MKRSQQRHKARRKLKKARRDNVSRREQAKRNAETQMYAFDKLRP